MDDHHEPRAETSLNENSKRLWPYSPDSCFPSMPNKVKVIKLKYITVTGLKVDYRLGRQNAALLWSAYQNNINCFWTDIIQFFLQFGSILHQRPPRN